MLHYLPREAMPAGLPRWHEMQQAARVLAQKGERFLGEKAARGGHAALVIDHAQALAGRRPRGNGAIEIPAARPVDPARPEDQVAAARRLHRALAGQPCLPIDTDWVRHVVFYVGKSFGAIEDIIGGVVHEKRAE